MWSVECSIEDASLLRLAKSISIGLANIYWTNVSAYSHLSRVGTVFSNPRMMSRECYCILCCLSRECGVDG